MKLLLIILFLSFTLTAETRKSYYPSGELKSEHSYHDGKINGFVKHYRKSGRLFLSQEFINDVQHGKATIFGKDGSYMVIPMVHGKMEGLQKSFKKNHTLIATLEFKNGKMHGEHILYSKPNIKLMVMHYKKGTIYKIELYSDDNSLRLVTLFDVNKKTLIDSYALNNVTKKRVLLSEEDKIEKFKNVNSKGFIDNILVPQK